MTRAFSLGDAVIQADEIPVLLKRYQLMPQFLREVIVDRAITDTECSEEERAASIEKFMNQHKLTSPEAKQAWLDSHGMAEDDLNHIAERSIKLEKFKKETWSNKVENYFVTRKSNLDQVVYSLIRTKNPGLAHEIYFRILEGEQEFAEAAREHSEGPESKTGGLLGPVSLAQPHPAISKLLSVSQPNQLWTPRPLSDWMVIIRLEKFIPAQLDDSMRRRLIDELFEKWMREQLSSVGSLEPVQTSPTSVSPVS
ncbi:MAG: peptidylprolyl isomerase [Microcoleaceae cyanobacterium]